MTKTVLNVDRVGKRYVEYRSDFSRIASWFGAKVDPVSEYWALRNISFSQAAGEALALIGSNGAGKSTLLKLITGTVRPTTGRVDVGGRISAILELGLGFDPDLTGRHNIYQAGGLMGYSASELTALLQDIESFAELGEFFDQPLRTYSSGMQARLAFSLATSTRPDVLIVDEVLSVGDSYYQHKSFNRIREFKQQGTSILLVTHSMGDVRELCDRVILLEKGKILMDGLPDEVVDYYNALIAEREQAKLTIEQRRDKSGWVISRSGTREAAIERIGLFDAATQTEVRSARVGQSLKLQIEVAVRADIPQLVLGIMIRDRTGHVVFGTNTWHTKQIVEGAIAGERVGFAIKFACDLGPGSYSISTSLTNSSTHLERNYEWADNLIVFDVANFDRAHFIGSSCLDVQFAIERLESKAGETHAGYQEGPS
jgi:lipopolysaccharide transport system ATP-binding protein